jgi:microcystin-dependent protein
MPVDPITRILVRRGNNSERKNIALWAGEPAYTVDTKRLYVGDNTTLGGNPVGMRNLGFTTFVQNQTYVNPLSSPEPGDVVFDLNSNLLWTLTGTQFQNKDNWRPFGSNLAADGITIGNYNNVLSVKQGSLDFSYFDSTNIGRGLELVDSGTEIRIATPAPEFTYSGNILNLTNNGITNSKLATMPGDTLKGRLGTVGTPSDIPLATLATILAGYVYGGGSGSEDLLVPVGALLDFAGASAPPGYLICDGSAISRNTYSDLFGVIGTAYGAGNGSTTFNLPDLRRRVTVGAGGTGTTTLGNTIGSVGGNENHLLSIQEIPSHTHTNDPNIIYDDLTGSNRYIAGGQRTNIASRNTGYTGGSQPHNNIQPSVVVNKIIKI